MKKVLNFASKNVYEPCLWQCNVNIAIVFAVNGPM